MHSRERLDVAEAKALQPRQPEPSDFARDVAQRVAANVAIVISVGCSTNPDAIQNNDRGSLQVRLPVYMRSTRDRSPVSSS